jgi:hypothetical protein
MYLQTTSAEWPTDPNPLGPHATKCGDSVGKQTTIRFETAQFYDWPWPSAAEIAAAAVRSSHAYRSIYSSAIKAERALHRSITGAQTPQEAAAE